MASVPDITGGTVDSEKGHLATSYVHFSRILVGTDFSEPASKALALAITIAETFGSELFIVHAVSPSIYVDGQEPMSAPILSAQLEAAKMRMKELVTNKPQSAGLRLKTTVAPGGPIDLINQVSKDEKITLVVLGSRGASGLEKVILGSAAETVLRKSSCPVVIAGPRCHVVQHPFRSILFATDLVTTGLRAAQYASALSEHVDGRITLLHVIQKCPDLLGVDVDLFENALREKMRSLLPSDVELFCRPKLRLEVGSPAQVIRKVAELEAASLIIVGLRKRSTLADHFPGATLSEVIREAKCGVLIVRDHLI